MQNAPAYRFTEARRISDFYARCRIMPTGCIEWTGARKGRNPNGHGAGYGVVSWTGRKLRYSHRIAWELMRGEIPAGMEIDHLCRNVTCVNPAHLEVVTHSENVKRYLDRRYANVRG